MRRDSRKLRAGRTLRNDVLRMTVGVASILIVTAAFTGVVALQPDVLGTWFTLYEEYEGAELVYKVEARIIAITVTSVDTATLDTEIRITNNHPYGIRMTITEFVIRDVNKNRIILTMYLGDTTIPTGCVKIIKKAECNAHSLSKLGNMYYVEGSMTWYEMHRKPTGRAGPFTASFSEVHSLKEFLRG
jgi:hypothetical protein